MIMLKTLLGKLNIFSYISFAKKTDAPAILYARFYKILTMAGLSLFILLSCIAAGIIFSAALIVSFGLLALGLFAGAFIYKHKLEAEGFTKIRGCIVFVKESISPSAQSLLKEGSVKRASYYLLRTKDGKTYRIPANKTGDDLPEGADVILYAPRDSGTYERSGITYLAAIWGYELAGGEKE